MLKYLFGKKTEKSLGLKIEDLPDGFVAKFEAFKDILLAVGEETGRDRTASAVSLNNKNAPYELGTKEWVKLDDSYLAIRYYDLANESCESLYTLELNEDKECFILQRKIEIATSEEAISVFMGLMGEYADPGFMRAIQCKLEESDVLDLTDQTLVGADVVNADTVDHQSTEATITQSKEPSKKIIKPVFV
jgi:hypothetical protein